MAKKKPHHKKGGIESYYQENKPDVIERTNFGWYEIRKLKKGYQLDIHKERGIDQQLLFEDKSTLDTYIEKHFK